MALVLTLFELRLGPLIKLLGGFNASDGFFCCITIHDASIQIDSITVALVGT